MCRVWSAVVRCVIVIAQCGQNLQYVLQKNHSVIITDFGLGAKKIVSRSVGICRYFAIYYDKNVAVIVIGVCKAHTFIFCTLFKIIFTIAQRLACITTFRHVSCYVVCLFFVHYGRSLLCTTPKIGQKTVPICQTTKNQKSQANQGKSRLLFVLCSKSPIPELL